MTDMSFFGILAIISILILYSIIIAEEVFNIFSFYAF